jgi:hypothetical protein
MNEFKLDNKPKITSGFTYPSTYFDGFSEKVMQKLPAAEPKVISIWARNKKWLYAVAAIVVLSLSIPFIYISQNNTTEVSSNEIENYLSYHSTLTDDDIVELLEKEDLDKIAIPNDLEDQVVEDILTENSNLEHYITN